MENPIEMDDLEVPSFQETLCEGDWEQQLEIRSKIETMPWDDLIG